PAGLAAEGYVLASGLERGHGVVALSGVDGAGTFYAVQTLRQLIGHHALPAVTVRDWPAMPIRGTIEGFYGTPWSHAARLDQLDYYGAHKMNTYVYSPKDDPYLRAQWRDAYPADKLAQLKELVDRAEANHVKFTYALSPGLSVCYSSAADEQALVDKFQSLWDIGVRDFAVPLDDISYTNWNCAADKEKFGTGGAAAGKAQAYLLNAVQRDFIATHEGASRLQMVPTEYYNVSESGYKRALREDLDPAVVVEWTGVGVIAPTITTAQAAQAKSVFGHDILVWDNYPVNDYVTDRLLLGPYVGRDAGMTDSLHGITANPMIQPEASKIALFGVADFTWNDDAYDPQQAWQAGIRELAGSDPQAQAALAAFADLNYSSRIDDQHAPALSAKVDAFWSAWEGGDDSAAAPLDDYFALVQSLPDVLAAQMHDPAFLDDTRPWLDSAAAWGTAGRTALRMLGDQRRGDGDAALQERAKLAGQVTTATSFVYHGLRGSTTVVGDDGVIEKFVNGALAESDRWLGIAGQHVSPFSSLPAYHDNALTRMLDGDQGTWFWSSRAATVGDTVGVDLGSVQPITSIEVDMAKSGSPDDYLHRAELELSTDGKTWTGVAATTSATVQATLPAGTTARYVRLRATGAQDNWVVVREFSVRGPDANRPTVEGSPAPAAGSRFADVVDADLDTAYTAASAPAGGDALVVHLPKARPLDLVEVVGRGSAQVQVRAEGSWTTVGSLSGGGYTEVDGRGLTADAVRLLWQAGSAAPSIAEVIPRYADQPAAELSLTPAAADLQVGQDTRVTVTVSSARPQTVRGSLLFGTVDGVSVDPAHQSVTVPRGAQPTLSATVSGGSVGTHAVPVTLERDGQVLARAELKVAVHPEVSATNVALASNGATATASSVELDLPQFTPDHAIDGDTSTRWSSGYADDAWLQVTFATPQDVGKLVLVWETAHATDYRIDVTTDGSTWQPAATVHDSAGGTETVWVDAQNVRAVRMQGVKRATSYGYSIKELEAYPVAG
ncbi:MAG TPA: beta-N-acetylglucosaminidase domain-containing protein, partial [Segeticoccus sp.]|uniref:beta-N-acetylglucosaminidase domain-containing protein n=1 Tax=Segeticoccus sp. TaxID=2706531 RepID=UPI002D7F0DCA